MPQLQLLAAKTKHRATSRRERTTDETPGGRALCKLSANDQERAPMPQKHVSPTKTLRWGLGALLIFAAINAFGGGVYGLMGAPAVPREWLTGTPFDSYRIPSLVLFLVVGGAFAFAAFSVLTARTYARPATLAAAIIVLGWIIVQVTMIGYVSWMQPTTFATGLVILALGARYPVPSASAEQHGQHAQLR